MTKPNIIVFVNLKSVLPHLHNQTCCMCKINFCIFFNSGLHIGGPDVNSHYKGPQCPSKKVKTIAYLVHIILYHCNVILMHCLTFGGVCRAVLGEKILLGGLPNCPFCLPLLWIALSFFHSLPYLLLIV